jgi:hypothetical protein
MRRLGDRGLWAGERRRPLHPLTWARRKEVAAASHPPTYDGNAPTGAGNLWGRRPMVSAEASGRFSEAQSGRPWP